MGSPGIGQPSPIDVGNAGKTAVVSSNQIELPAVELSGTVWAESSSIKMPFSPRSLRTPI
jgi:hypothetical protein